MYGSRHGKDQRPEALQAKSEAKKGIGKLESVPSMAAQSHESYRGPSSNGFESGGVNDLLSLLPLSIFLQVLNTREPGIHGSGLQCLEPCDRL